MRTFGGGFERTAPAKHASLEVGGRAVLFCPLGAWQHDVGNRRGLREEEVGDDQQVERLKALLNPIGFRGGHQDVGADDQQGPHAVVATERLEQLEGRLPGTRNRGLGHIPYRRHVAARGGIVDLPVAGKLVRLLAVLAPSLSVPLAGDRAVAAEGLAHLPERQRDVDVGERVVDALRLLLGTPAGQHDDAFRCAQRARGIDESRLSHTGQPFDALRPIRRGELPHLVESFGPAGDIAGVDQVIADQDMKDPVGQRGVRPRT